MTARKRRGLRPPKDSSRPPRTPAPARKGRRFSPIVVAVVAVALVLAALAAIGMLGVYPSKKGPGAGRDVELVLVGDESKGALASRLESAGLVQDPQFFAWYARFANAKIAKGAHLLTDDLTPREILARIERKGAAVRVKVTIPEGFTRFDIARRMHALHVCTQAALTLATEDPALLEELHLDGASAEGFLFPATYELSTDSDPADVVRRMKAEFDKRWAALDQKHPSGILDLLQSLGWGIREIVNLASIIEKEAAVDEERPIIASVFLNRLRDPNFKRRVLQSDPTAGYGCLVAKEKLPSCAGYTGRITHDINADPANAYSTYTHEKLPPGPISNPGAKSIEAVMNPATTRYLYFVARGEGHHSFSESYEGHSAAVKDSGPRR